ncbi:MAG: DUF333 domain-containing protein [Candidatus Aenigmarchaeota archaeon]|nr:DUF333 domain-containing protein [Candidatus Aenigmarchaeota archaeon]
MDLKANDDVLIVTTALLIVCVVFAGPNIISLFSTDTDIVYATEPKDDAPLEKTMGFANPAAVYCQNLGYEYEIVRTDESSYGLCVFNDGFKCNAWDFFRGKCGKDYSYCAKKGYETKYISEQIGSATYKYAVCVVPADAPEGGALGVKTTETKEIPVLELMDANNEPLFKGDGFLPKDDLIVDDEEKKTTKIAALGGYDYPPSLDWRDNGGDWVTPVKNQWACGSCWAFTTISAVESRRKIELNNPDYDIDLSEQTLVSCSDAGNCDGGSPKLSLNYIKNKGIVDESCFSYLGCKDWNSTGKDCIEEYVCEKCLNWKDNMINVVNYEKLPASADAIKQAIKDYGPVIAYMVVYDNFDFYSSGIYNNPTGTYTGTHAISIIGYNDIKSYWLCKNSWGSWWGENGYFKIDYSENVFDFKAWNKTKDKKGCFFLDRSYVVTQTGVGPGDGGEEEHEEAEEKLKGDDFTSTAPEMTQEIIIEVTVDYYYSTEKEAEFTILGNDN